MSKTAISVPVPPVTEITPALLNTMSTVSEKTGNHRVKGETDIFGGTGRHRPWQQGLETSKTQREIDAGNVRWPPPLDFLPHQK